jgi:prephenate dehydratase
MFMRWGQCRKVVRANGWKAVVAGDTAGAARLVSESGDRTMAALCTKIWRPNSMGWISWLRMSRTPKPMSPVSWCCRARPKFRRARWRTRWSSPPSCSGSATFPAALYKAMGGFATNGVNMTKLESYQIGGKFFATQFYADIQGHPDEPPVARAMEELGFFSKELRILGVYPAHPFRLRRTAGSRRRDRGLKRAVTGPSRASRASDGGRWRRVAAPRHPPRQGSMPALPRSRSGRTSGSLPARPCRG